MRYWSRGRLLWRESRRGSGDSGPSGCDYESIHQLQCPTNIGSSYLKITVFTSRESTPRLRSCSVIGTAGPVAFVTSSMNFWTQDVYSSRVAYGVSVYISGHCVLVFMKFYRRKMLDK